MSGYVVTFEIKGDDTTYSLGLGVWPAELRERFVGFLEAEPDIHSLRITETTETSRHVK